MAIMTSIIISVIVGFVLVIKRVDTKIKTSNDMLNTVIVQDEINLQTLGMELEKDLSGQVEKVKTSTDKSIDSFNKSLSGMNKSLGTMSNTMTGLSLANTSNSANMASTNTRISSMSASLKEVSQEQYIMEHNKGRFDSKLTIGPATIYRQSNGELAFDTAGGIFTVSSSNMTLTPSGLDIGGNLTVKKGIQLPPASASYPGPLISQEYSDGTRWGLTQVDGSTRMFAPTNKSISLGFSNNNTVTSFNETILIKSNPVTRDMVTVTGDLNVTGTINNAQLALALSTATEALRIANAARLEARAITGQETA